MFGEASDVDDLGQQAGGDHSAQALDGDDGIGYRVDDARDVLVEPLHETLDEANVVPTGGQGRSDHLVHLRVDGIRRTQGLADLASSGSGVREVPSTATVDQVDQLVVRHLGELGDGELGEQGDAGGAKDVGEGLDPLPIAALEKGIGLEAHLLA